MATIASNSAAPAAAPFATNGSSGGAASGAPAANDSSGSFMRLVTGMIQGNTTPDQLPSNLVEFLLTGEGAALEGLDTDTSADDEDSEELDALEALLGGLQIAKPPAPPEAGSGDSTVSIDAAGRRESNVQQLMGRLGTSQETLTAALDDVAADILTTSSTDSSEATLTAGATQQSNSASPMQHLLAAHRAAEGAPQAASAEVRTPVGSQAWADEVGTHLTMMAANGRESASLRLSPEHLGPLEVRISMKDGEASITFGASNPDTRSALEQSLPRLREMFASQGLVLGDANVSRDAPRDSFKPATFANASRNSSDAGVETDVKRVTLGRVGLVDTYV
jgi:flagellar hook-length control protein FliK